MSANPNEGGVSFAGLQMDMEDLQAIAGILSSIAVVYSVIYIQGDGV